RPTGCLPSADHFLRTPTRRGAEPMKRSDVIWSLIGVGAVVFSCFLLYHEIRDISLDDLPDSRLATAPCPLLLSARATAGASAALACYDRIALKPLRKNLAFWFSPLCSFTTYAPAHSVGASVFSGALVRHRAYRTKGLSPQEIG